jgi:hypothetical protein
MKRRDLEVELTKATNRYRRAEELLNRSIDETESYKLSLESARMFVKGVMVKTGTEAISFDREELDVIHKTKEVYFSGIETEDGNFKGTTLVVKDAEIQSETPDN